MTVKFTWLTLSELKNSSLTRRCNTARESDIHSIFSERANIGLSAPLALSAIAGQCAITMKLIAGGTLEIGGQSQTLGSLYPLGASEVMNMANAGKFWLYASGATCTIAIIRGKTDGV